VHTLFPSLPLQVVGRRGAPNVKGERGRKLGHIALTMCYPAAGPAMAPFWTFAGTSARSRIPGTKAGWFQCTENGWPDEVSFILWCQKFVEHLEARGLKKALLYCDNAALHCNKTALAILARAKVRVIGLIPGCTGWMQPLDVGFFGPLKKT
jgi:hypothetical protein